MRDFMECDPVYGIFRESQFLGQVPGDGFPFTVRVGCQIDLSGLCRLVLQILHDFFFIP